MLEEFAKVSYRYFLEARVYVVFCVALFGITALYVNFSDGWGDGTPWGTLVLFMGVFGQPIMLGFCLCVVFLSFIYAFHPELNGKAEGRGVRLWLIRLVCACAAVGAVVMATLTALGNASQIP